MILYHKNINHSRYIDSLNFTRKCLLEWNSAITECYCFYYSHNDRFDNIPFLNSIDKKHVTFLKKNKQIKILYDFCGEPIFAKSEILDIVKIVEEWQLSKDQVIIIALDSFQEKYLKEILKKSQKKSIIKVVVYNLYLDMLNPENTDNLKTVEKKKFSILCRRHRPWRTYLYSELFDNGLLDYFHFSYHGIDNFENLTTTSIIQDVFKYCKKRIKNNFKKFLNNRPYSIDITDCYYSCVEDYLYNSDIHIAVEHAEFDERNLKTIRRQNYFAQIDTFGNVCSVGPESAFKKTDQNLVRINYDLFEKVCCKKITLDQCRLHINPNDLDLIEGQEHFISEKIYKPIAAEKPFIVFSEQGYLKALRELGFSTFSPYIDESYDNELDPKSRISLIIQEIKRINELPYEEYQELLKECNKIAIQNNVVFETLKKSNKLNF